MNFTQDLSQRCTLTSSPPRGSPGFSPVWVDAPPPDHRSSFDHDRGQPSSSPTLPLLNSPEHQQLWARLRGGRPCSAPRGRLLHCIPSFMSGLHTPASSSGTALPVVSGVVPHWGSPTSSISFLERLSCGPLPGGPSLYPQDTRACCSPPLGPDFIASSVNLRGRDCDAHFLEEETEAQRVQGSSPRSHSLDLHLGPISMTTELCPFLTPRGSV